MRGIVFFNFASCDPLSLSNLPLFLNRLQNKKRDLARKAGDTARMKQENDEMEYRMKQLEENHE